MKVTSVVVGLLSLLAAGPIADRTAFADCVNGLGECSWIDNHDEVDPFNPDDPHHCAMGCDPESIEPQGEWEWSHGPQAVETTHNDPEVHGGYGTNAHGCCEGMDPEGAGCLLGPDGELTALASIAPTPMPYDPRDPYATFGT
jgi:hypothetical protein